LAKKTEAPMIIARGLTKKYDNLVAVDGIDFEVKKGESFGLLGLRHRFNGGHGTARADS
jgi:ABC-type branched-subunit amino acid transport system ATPase component